EPITYNLINSQKSYTQLQLLDINVVTKINNVLLDLATLKTYYQFQLAQTKNEEQRLILTEKIDACTYTAMTLTQTYFDAVNSSQYGLITESFSASRITKVGTETLNWQGASVAARY